MPQSRQVRRGIVHTTGFRLLRALCARRQDGEAITALAGQVADWEAFRRLVVRHRIAGVVHRALERHAAAPVPAATRAAVAAMAAAIARENMVTAFETTRLQRAFDREAIGVVFFKGVTLSQRAYGAITVKQGKDIDFVVTPEDAPRCIALLEREGYRLFTPRPVLGERQWRDVRRFGMEVGMLHTTSGVQIEPHWRLSENPRLLSLARMISAADRERAVIGDVSITTFHPDDEFAYLCMHGARSGWFRLKWLADVDALLGAATPAEIMRLAAHAESLGVGPAAWLALALCQALFDRDVPRDILDRASSKWSLRRLRSLSLSNMAVAEPGPSGARTLVGSLLVAAAHGHVLSEIWRWTVSVEDLIEFPLPDRLYFLYRVLRLPFWIVRKLRAALGGGAGLRPAKPYRMTANG